MMLQCQIARPKDPAMSASDAVRSTVYLDAANGHFLMRPLTDHRDFDRAETTEMRWATLKEAAALIDETTNAKGRARDRAVLAAVEAMLSR
jgi:hypothetical protein